MAFTVPYSVLGLTVSGDLGGITIYTDRFGRKIAFPQAPPKKPPTPNQVHQRARFATAQKAWATLPVEQKALLELASVRGSVPFTGQNLYISVALKNDASALDNLATQTGLTLPVVPFIP